MFNGSSNNSNGNGNSSSNININNPGNDAHGRNDGYNNANISAFQGRLSHNPAAHQSNANPALANSASNNPYYNNTRNTALFMRSSHAAQHQHQQLNQIQQQLQQQQHHHRQQQQQQLQQQLQRQQQHQQQHDPLPQTSQSRTLGQSLSEQQQRLMQMSEIEVQQIANNIKESLQIKQHLASIRTLRQQELEEATKVRIELQIKAAAQQQQEQATSAALGAKTIPSNSNSSVLPTIQREDEMTKPDLSTLAETAVAVATATASAAANVRRRSNNNNCGNNSNISMALRNMIKMDRANTNTNTTTSTIMDDNNRIAELLGRQASSSTSTKIGLIATGRQPSTRAASTGRITNTATMDALRRETTSTSQKLYLGNSFKQSSVERVKNNATAVNPPWLWNSSTVGTNIDNNANMLTEQLRTQDQHLHLLRRNSLPTIPSEYASTTSRKRQRLLEQKMKEVGGFGLSDAMEQIRRFDTSMKMTMNMKNESALHAQLAAKMAKAKNAIVSLSSSSLSQERRSSFASSVASAPPITPDLTKHNQFGSPATTRNSSISMDGAGSVEDRLIALEKLNKFGGGFPMPKSFMRHTLDSSAEEVNSAAADRNKSSNIPTEITSDCTKGVVDVAVIETYSASGKELDQQPQQIDHQLKYLEQIGGFPMPSLYRNSLGKSVGNNRNNETVAMDTKRNRCDDSITNIESHSHNRNLISNHIKSSVNRNGNDAKASRPLALDHYKRVWRDIRLARGDDPEVDERLRKEIFARKLQRGELFGNGRSNSITITNNNNIDGQEQQRRLSEISHNSNESDNNGNNSERTNSETGVDESLVI